MPEIRVRRATPDDISKLIPLRIGLWPGTPEEHLAELKGLLEGHDGSVFDCAVFLAETPQGDVAGFLEAGLRSHADGCDPAHPVGYVEGWYVSDDFRRQGIAAKLLAAAESWARDHGCREMASDTWIDRPVAQHAHEHLGFEVVDRCVHYRKPL